MCGALVVVVSAPQRALSPRRRKVWRSALRDLERWARTFPLHAPAARRERALWCGHHNNERGALEAIERSLSLARDASMCGEEAFSLRVRAWLAERFGWAGISADRRQAQALMEQLAPTAQQVQQVRALVWGEGEGYSSEQEPSRQNLSRPPQSSAVAQAGA
jgi:uncharacterized membrane protein